MTMNRGTRRRMTPAQRAQLQAAEDLDLAWLQYRRAAAAAAAVTQCSSWWVDGETQCQLLAGHDGQHRHRPRGASVAVVTW